MKIRPVGVAVIHEDGRDDGNSHLSHANATENNQINRFGISHLWNEHEIIIASDNKLQYWRSLERNKCSGCVVTRVVPEQLIPCH